MVGSPFPSEGWPAPLYAPLCDQGQGTRTGREACQVCGWTQPPPSAGVGAEARFVLLKAEGFRELEPAGTDVEVQARASLYVCTHASCRDAQRWQPAWEAREDRLAHARATQVQEEALAAAMGGFVVGAKDGIVRVRQGAGRELALLIFPLPLLALFLSHPGSRLCEGGG